MNIKNKEAIEKITFGVFKVFSDLNKVSSPNKSHIFQLVKIFKQDSKNFQDAFELAYLKVFKSFHQKANKKIPTKFEELAESFFKQIFPKQQEQICHASEVILSQFNTFLNMLSQGIFSSISGIRIMCGRMIFLLLKLMPPNSSEGLKQKTKEHILRAVLHMVRLKIQMYRQIGIKISSMVLSWEGNFVDKIETQLFKIASTDDNPQARKSAIINLMVKAANIDRLLIRLRDKNPQIKTIVLRKLAGQRFSIAKMSQNNIYKLLYDGYGNKDVLVQKQTLKYFALFFHQSDSRMQMDIQNVFEYFLYLFQPEILLVNPQLYVLFDNLIADLLTELPIAKVTLYIQKLCLQVKNSYKNGQKIRASCQLIWLKNAINSSSKEVSNVFQECSPSGLQMAKVLLDLVQRQQIFGIYEFLQLFALQKTPDQIGRNKMFDALKKTLSEMAYFQLKPNYSKLNEEDDICSIQNDETIKQKKLLLSYFDIPIISNSFDLIFQIGAAMKALRPEYYEIEMKEIMAQWNNPEENTLQKQKHITLTNISKMKALNDQKSLRLLKTLEQKLQLIQSQLQRESSKTKMIIMAISRLNHNSNMEDYMPIIKQSLTRRDQSQGLVLLGLYALQSIEKVQTFFPLYWHHLKKQGSKLEVLVSLKVSTDFIVKFNLMNNECKLNIDSQQEFNYDLFLKNMLRLCLHQDVDIRILAIQCLCRMVYHGRVDQSNLGISFLYILLLWWETSSQEVSAKSVHIISIFIRSYIEKGNTQVKKLSEMLCIFFKLLLKFQRQNKVINKKFIVYNLKMQEFIKRAVNIAITVLKYHKQSRQIIWKYQDEGVQLGPQELFMLYLMNQGGFQHILEKTFSICDFYEDAPLQTLIFVKKQIQNVSKNLNISKKFDSQIQKFETQIQEKISVKQQKTFNNQLLLGIQKQFKEYSIYIQQEAKRLAKNIEDSEIFVPRQDEEQEQQQVSRSQQSEEDQKEEIQKVIQEIQASRIISVEDISSQQDNIRKISEQQEGESFSNSKNESIVSSEQKNKHYYKNNRQKSKTSKSRPKNLKIKKVLPPENNVVQKQASPNVIARKTRSRYIP